MRYLPPQSIASHKVFFLDKIIFPVFGYLIFKNNSQHCPPKGKNCFLSWVIFHYICSNSCSISFTSIVNIEYAKNITKSLSSYLYLLHRNYHSSSSSIPNQKLKYHGENDFSKYNIFLHEKILICPNLCGTPSSFVPDKMTFFIFENNLTLKFSFYH